MGTRFCATREAPIHAEIKQAFLSANEHDTRLILRSFKNTSRVLDNAIARAVISLEQRPAGCRFDDVRPLVSGARGRGALEQGDVHGGVITAGQCIGLIDDIPTCAELVQRMVDECHESLIRTMRYMR
jgi:NADH:quinone reductase (non-electrogenic)